MIPMDREGGGGYLLLPFPFIVWGADELRRWFLRRR